ncbi:hypothetical protein JTB14_010696 [Gonioctena quinquepunctata]|nr:hypothetical protein JTB14_010696 [Gonioctena quinquepunctata]
MWFNCLVQVISVLCMFETIWAKPFLNNAPAAITNLATSASASASSIATPLTHIADLTRRQEKAEKLRAEKQLIEDDQFQFEENADEDTNEASPSLLQKKFNKLVTKIRFFTGLSAAVTNNNRDSYEELEDFFNSTAEVTTPDSPTFQKVIYPHGKNRAPLKLNLKIGKGDASEEAMNADVGEDVVVMGRIGQIGVFFAELLGSVVGLAYGAAAHLNNALQATTPQSDT